MSRTSMLAKYKLNPEFRVLLQNLLDGKEETGRMLFKDLRVPQGRAVTSIDEVDHFEKEQKPVIDALVKAGIIIQSDETVSYVDKG